MVELVAVHVEGEEAVGLVVLRLEAGYSHLVGAEDVEAILGGRAVLALQLHDDLVRVLHVADDLEIALGRARDLHLALVGAVGHADRVARLGGLHRRDDRLVFRVLAHLQRVVRPLRRLLHAGRVLGGRVLGGHRRRG